jgi:PRTRC genetic system ThiF family protein
MKKILTWPDRLLTNEVNVAVIGAGGNGSEVMDALVKMHYAMLCLGHDKGLNITLIDDDTVSESNIIRQRFWPHEVGQAKSTTLIHKNNLMFGTKWRSIEDQYPLNDETGLDFDPDIVISCVDNIKARKAISLGFKDIETEALWLDLGNTKSTGQVVLGHLGIPSADRIDNVIDMYPQLLTAVDKENQASCSSAESISRQDLLVNPKMANAAINLLWQLLRKRELSHNGIIVDLENLTESPIPIM